MVFCSIKRVFGKNLPSEHILALKLHPLFFFLAGTGSKKKALKLGIGLLELATTAWSACSFSGFIIIQVTFMLSKNPAPAELCYLSYFAQATVSEHSPQ